MCLFKNRGCNQQVPPVTFWKVDLLADEKKKKLIWRVKSDHWHSMWSLFSSISDKGAKHSRTLTNIPRSVPWTYTAGLRSFWFERWTPQGFFFTRLLSAIGRVGPFRVSWTIVKLSTVVCHAYFPLVRKCSVRLYGKSLCQPWIVSVFFNIDCQLTSCCMRSVRGVTSLRVHSNLNKAE